MVRFKCQQKLCGFPEGKNVNRRKALICEFHKKSQLPMRFIKEKI